MASTAKIDHGLKFLHKAFGTKSLHFGLFLDGQAPTIAGLREAQEEYTRTLIGMIPDGVKSVLDVGCGLGGTTKTLIESGYEASGLSPDLYHEEQFPITCGPEATFHLSTFEDFAAERPYDCLLFSESPQYINKDAFFPKCVELTRPGSHVLVSDFFIIAPGGAYANSFLEPDFVDRAKRAGFVVAQHRDITDEIMPNFDIMEKFLAYGQNLLEASVDTARRHSPRLWKLVWIFFGRKIRRVHKYIHEKLPAQFDRERFRKTMHYARYLLTRQADS